MSYHIVVCILNRPILVVVVVVVVYIFAQFIRFAGFTQKIEMRKSIEVICKSGNVDLYL